MTSHKNQCSSFTVENCDRGNENKPLKIQKREQCHAQTNQHVKGVLLAVSLAATIGTVGMFAYTHMLVGAVAERENGTLHHLVSIRRRLSKTKETQTPLQEIPGMCEAKPIFSRCLRLSIRSDDGLRLYAHWYRAPHACRTLLLAHGWHGHWYRDFTPLVADLAKRNCNLLLIEQRAHDDSEGRYITMGLSERYDIAKWAFLLAQLEPSLPLYLCGISMGAASVLQASALSLPPQVCGVISDATFSSAQEIISLVMRRNIHASPLPNMWLLNHYLQKHAGFRYDTGSSPLEAVQQMHLPVLFVHGTADCFVPFSMTEQCYAACQAEKELFAVPGADHCGSYLTDHKGYLNVLDRFFEKHDSRFLQGKDFDK